MSEYWKSTPSYWCKFCSQYVRDTNIERKNHEATAKHQNNIQRSLRELHKNHERENREKQQAKDEVARLNGLVNGKSGPAQSKPPAPAPKVTQAPAPSLSTAAQRKAHAEQLAALGVELPEELKKEVTGVGSYHVVTERSVEPAQDGSITVNRSLADILAESKREPSEVREETEDDEQSHSEAGSKGVRKRKAEDDDDIRDEEAARKRKPWGSNIKSYPGKNKDEDTGDLDALLSGVAKRKEPVVKPEKVEESDTVKKEEDADAEPSKTLNALPDIDAPVKHEDATSTPAVVFKKRKGKK